MTFEQMLAIAPVYVYLRAGVYHCNWSPKNVAGVWVHGRGLADSPFRAVAHAWQDAVAKGWVKP